jgi:hypothetical protein
MGTIAARTISQRKLNETVIVGKDVLELLSSAMYVDPLCIYREYVQNAADAIDEARAEGLYSNNATPRIDISINVAERSIKIRDNGIGIPPNTFSRRLTSLGASKKRGSKARGFRGVGRLSGLAYCQQLIFRSKSKDAPRVWEVRWDCRRLRELLNDHTFTGDLNEVMYEALEFDTFEEAACPIHFFEVELRRVNRIRGDILLNEAGVGNYLSQVAPVPFAKSFSFGKRISSYLTRRDVGASYKIYLNKCDKPIYRPFKNTFAAKQTLDDKFTELEFFEVPGVNGERDAVGWILHHNYHGTLPDRLGIKGLRLRLGNIQVGDDKIFESTFREPRFNGWAVGEVHIASPRLLPNGRRDALEQNVHQQNLLNHLGPHAKTIGKLCRTKSAERNRAKKEKKDDRGDGTLTERSHKAERSWLRSMKCEQLLSNVSANRREAYQDLFCLMLRSRKSNQATKAFICEVLRKIASGS